MGFYDRIESFQGIRVIDFEREHPPKSVRGNGWRLSIDYEDSEDGKTIEQDLVQLLATADSDSIEALIIGGWEGSAEGGNSESIVESLVAVREQLPNLRHLFLAEMLQEECEVSWINHGDISPLFLTFPQLETLQVRGSAGLSLGRPSHAKIQTLILQGGGLPGSIVREICSANLPELEHLELWLGSDEYGGDTTASDLHPVLNGSLFPKLKYLGLRNSHNTDEVVGWLENAILLQRLDTLDLSLGTLTDDGAERLANIPQIANLKSLNLSHHFLSPKGIDLLTKAFPGVSIDTSDTQEADEYSGEIYRYNFVSE